MSLLFISHDFGAVASTCERIAVMDDGRMVESGPTASVLTNHRAAAVRTLLHAVPRLDP